MKRISHRATQNFYYGVLVDENISVGSYAYNRSEAFELIANLFKGLGFSVYSYFIRYDSATYTYKFYSSNPYDYVP